MRLNPFSKWCQFIDSFQIPDNVWINLTLNKKCFRSSLAGYQSFSFFFIYTLGFWWFWFIFLFFGIIFTIKGAPFQNFIKYSFFTNNKLLLNFKKILILLAKPAFFNLNSFFHYFSLFLFLFPLLSLLSVISNLNAKLNKLEIILKKSVAVQF